MRQVNSRLALNVTLAPGYGRNSIVNKSASPSLSLGALASWRANSKELSSLVLSSLLSAAFSPRIGLQARLGRSDKLPRRFPMSS